MFTGIIEELGTVRTIAKKNRSAFVTISAAKVLEGLRKGDSIAVNGVCLTVTDFDDFSFSAELSEETLSVTKFSALQNNEKVNLERALKLSDRLSGHIVTGHIDCVGTVVKRVDEGGFSVFFISFDKVFNRYVIKKGSIAIDGVSLTINELTQDGVRLNIIPHTLKVTNLQYLKSYSKVNIEFDVLGKYIEKLINKDESKITMDFLAKTGFTGGNIL
ncbi:MAG: riboflavin synthase [bacterium]